MTKTKVRKDVYVKTRLSKRPHKAYKTVPLFQGQLIADLNHKYEIIGIEILDAKEVAVNGKKV